MAKVWETADSTEDSASSPKEEILGALLRSEEQRPKVYSSFKKINYEQSQKSG